MIKQPETWIKFLKDTGLDEKTRAELQKFLGASLILGVEPTATRSIKK